MRIAAHFNLALQAHPLAASGGWEQDRYNDTAAAQDGQSFGRPAYCFDAL